LPFNLRVFAPCLEGELALGGLPTSWRVQDGGSSILVGGRAGLTGFWRIGRAEDGCADVPKIPGGCAPG